MQNDSYVGFVETTGLGRALQAAQAMVAAGEVELLGHERCGDRVIVFVGGARGDVDAAVEAGGRAVGDNPHVARTGVVSLELASEFQEPLARFRERPAREIAPAEADASGSTADD